MRRTNRISATALAGLALAAPFVSAHAQNREYTVVAGSAPRDPTNTLPLKTTRIARFTTDEGSWMSLSVSPDGRTILFDLLGDLYTLPIAGGKATRIVGGNQLDVQPTYSPDGKMIAFVSDRSGSDQLWVANADGSNPVRLSHVETGRQGVGSFPVWTPDGQYIMVGRTLYHPAGGEGVTLPFTGVTGFSPDGKRAYGSGGRGQINVFDRVTGKSQVLVSSSTGAMQGAVSPDGKKLAYFTRYDFRTALMIRDLESGDEKVLKMDVQHDAGARSAGFGAMPTPAWLKDNSAILTSYGGKIWKIDATSGKPTMIPFTADVEQYLGPLSRFRYPITDTFTVRQIRDAQPSPDARRLAFTALDKLYLTTLSGGTPTRVTTATHVVEHSPTWSPDGRYLVFATWTDEAGGDLYRVNADGSGIRKLTTTSSYYVRPTYSPDGRRIVFGTGPWVSRRNIVDRLSGALDDAPLTLAWMNADGGQIHEIVEVSTVYANLPDGPLAHFGPDSSRVLFYGTGGGIVPPAPVPGGGRGGGGGASGAGLQSVRWDGSDRRALFSGDPITLSPNGAYGFAMNPGAHRIYVFPTPIIGTPIQLDVRADKPLVPAQVAIEVGGEFPGWTRDSRYMFFSLGHSFFLYDIAEAMKARADSIKQEWPRQLAGDTLPVPGADTLPLRPAYTPRRFDIKVAATEYKPSGTVVLKGARVITMKGDEVIERADVVVTDNRIRAVGPTGRVTIPAGATTIDVTGKTIVPGWVDVHLHTWPAIDVHKTAVPSFHSHLAFGITTGRDPQTNTSSNITYGDRLRSGDLIGPRFFGTGQGVFTGDEILTLHRARDVVKRYAEFYQTQTLKEYVAGNRRTRQLIVQATYEQGLTPTTEGAGDLKMSITEMLDGYAGHEHAYEIYPLFKDFALLSAASEITYTPTLLVNYGGTESKHYMIARDNAYEDPRLRRFTFQPDLARRTREAVWVPEDEFIFNGVAGAAANIVKHGGLVGIGAHHEVQGMGTPWEVILMAKGGMPLHDVLRTGTIFGATSIGLDRDVGSVEVGKLADLQVLDGNPLADINNVKRLRYVMKNGQLFEAETLNEVWPQKRALGRPWWLEWLPPTGFTPEQQGSRAPRRP